MEGEERRRSCKTPGELYMSTGYSEDLWHSTPVKKNLFADEISDVSSSKLREETRTKPTALTQNLSKPSFSVSQDFQTSANGVEITTIQRQRLELQLLIAELKDRDQELNAMAAAHHRQMLSWEQDRQRVLILEQRCARLEDELEKRNEVIRALSKRTRVVEAREKDVHRELNSTQQQLHDMSQKQLNNSRHHQDLEEKNQSLSSTIMMLSSQVGQLQVREEELNSMLKLKDKDVIEATNHILELSGRLCEMEKSLEKLRTDESKILRETEENKWRYRESRHENTQLKADIQEKTIENNNQREDLIRLKQENQLLKKELTAAELQILSDDKSWKDELLELSRSKQARAESELLCLRQVCENQQNDLQLLKLNLESTRETLRQHEGQRSFGRADSGVGVSDVLENSDSQESEIETQLILSQCHSGSRNIPSVLSQHPFVEMETQTDFRPDFDSTTLSLTNQKVTEQTDLNSSPTKDTASQGISSELDTHDCEKEVIEKKSEEAATNESSCNESRLQSTPPAVPSHHTNSPAEVKPRQAVYSEDGAAVDLVAVIDYDPQTGTPVYFVDINPRLPCATDLSCLHLDCPSPSPSHRSRRSSDRLNDSALSIEFNGNEEAHNSSTSRLQRLLAESREMVASLECSAGKAVGVARSSNNCDAVCRLQCSHGNDSRHNHSQSSTHSHEDSQTGKESDSQVKCSLHLQEGNKD